MGLQTFLITGFLIVCAIIVSMLVDRDTSQTTMASSIRTRSSSYLPIEETEVEDEGQSFDNAGNNDLTSKAESNVLEEVQSASSRKSLPDSCKRLIAHQNGHWEHVKLSDNDRSPVPDDASIKQMYFPKEMSWLNGQQKGSGRSNQIGACSKESDEYLMYSSRLGHLCGCGVTAFKPTHSVWVHDKADAMPETDPLPKPDYFTTSPTLRLARKLATADATVCFAGDSVDHQIYSSISMNLRRVDLLHKLYHPDKSALVSVMEREIPVTYSTDPGNGGWFLHGRRPPDYDNRTGSFDNPFKPVPGGFGHHSMQSILETEAIFNDEQPGSSVKRAKFRYYMSYAWSPWIIKFMEDCNVIIMSLALHYNPDEGEHKGRENKHPLMADTLAAITFLSNFTASKDNRVAVWRSALPQHFPTSNGNFDYGRKKVTSSLGDSTCSAIDKDPRKQQVYNAVHDEAFLKMCQLDQHADNSTYQSCEQFRYRCSVNPAAEVDYQTLFNFWRVNNCTDRIEAEKLRLNKFSGDHISGTIHRWDIFNLFNVEWWHVKNKDCTHFCYVPPLFEAAFERLELLLSPFVA